MLFRSIPHVMALPRALGVLLAFFAPAPMAIVLGHLLPRGLARIPSAQAHLVPWAFAINATAGTVATALASPVAYAFGFTSLLFLGALTYLAVALLPEPPDGGGSAP